MSGDSSNTSGASTGVSSSRRRGGVVNGISKRCWYGEEILPLMSKSDKNPYRRYFRCAFAVRKKVSCLSLAVLFIVVLFELGSLISCIVFCHRF